MAKKSNVTDIRKGGKPKRADGGEREAEATKKAVASVANLVDVLFAFAQVKHGEAVNEFAAAMRNRQAELRVTIEYDHDGLTGLRLYDLRNQQPVEIMDLLPKHSTH